MSMQIEIEKICRTCLGLSGPLLSIYDGSVAPTFSVADMLGQFTKIKPKQNDNMPEKVCLSCISEINHCYSFMLKCENSNRTLRQLLPNALPEEKEPVTTTAIKEKPALVEKSVQTMRLAGKSQFVQTEGQSQLRKSNSTIHSKNKEKSPLSSPHKRRNTYNNLSNPNESETQQTLLVYKAIANEVSSTNEIILEFEDVSDGTPGEEFIIGEDEPMLKAKQEENTYYEIARDFDNELENIRSEQDTLDMKDVKFTIYNNSDGEAQIVVKHGSNIQKEVREKVEHQCPQCIATFVSLKNLKRHLLKRHFVTEETTEPTNSDEYNISEESMSQDQAETSNKRHEDSSNNTNETKCTKLAEEINNAIQPIVTDTIPKKLRFFCDRCKAGFARQKSLHFHRNQNACQVKSFECEECKRVFMTQSNLDEHKATHVHSDICNLCNKSFKTRDDLSEHMVKEHNRNIRNQCHICKKVFSMVSALKDHLRVHSGEKPYVCSICNKAFSQNANLQQHIRRHAQDKKFKCDECSKSYVTKGELLSHKRSHSGDAPFKCDFCESSFTTSSSLLKHKRKHTGERPYGCDLCPMRFAALNVMKNHRRTHTGEQPYKCQYCSKSFTQRGDCLVHLRTHTGERNYVCFCGEKFTHRSTLRMHMKIHDKDKTASSAETADDSSAADANEFALEVQDKDEDLVWAEDLEKL